MEKNILIRYNEIHLKGRNRHFFEDLLYKNIENAVFEYKHELQKVSGRYILSGYNEKDEKKILNKLACVAGVYSVSPSFVIDTDYNDISSLAVELMAKKKGTFKIETNRADKTFLDSSMRISASIGGDVLESNSNLEVDIHNPEHVLFIDIRENKKTFIYNQIILGVGGMPVGSSGQGLVLLSGGIDSPVAGYMVAKRGMPISALHFHSYPYTSEDAKNKVIELGKIISKYTGHFKLFVCSFTEIQESIHKNCNNEFMITIMRRIMYRIAERVAKSDGCQSIITGENLGQVASQTVESMTVTNAVVEGLPIFRPLIAFDKEEITNISKKMGAFDTSILPYEDCCTVFLPKHPVIKPKIEKCLFEESKLDLENLINNAISSDEIINI